MTDTSRRKVLAAGVAGTAAGAVSLAGAGRAAAASPRPGRAREAVLAYVEDHTGDTVTFLIGEREVVVRDRDLVTRILNAAGGN